MKKTALVIGATGLVGNALVLQLIQHSAFESIVLFSRRSLNLTHEKITEHIVDFDQPDKWKELVQGDVLFSAMGTTIKKAKTKDAQYKIDYTYQYQTAKTASENGVKQYVLVSSAGANEKAKVFYSRIKGELEVAIKKLNFEQINIIQPSVLVGKRNEVRLGERFGIVIGNVFCKLPFLKKYRPIRAEFVAQAMINSSLIKNLGIQTYTLNKVFELAQNGQEE